MAALTAAFDWASSPLGPRGRWPESLRTAVGILLQSEHPMFIWWGPQLIQFYNDAYRTTMGPERHPIALGQPGRDCWEEIWPIIGPQIESIMAGGDSTWHEDQLVPVTRHGRREDVWWTYGYSPIPDQDKVGGVLVVCTDVTHEHLATEELLRLNARLKDEIEQRRYENVRQTMMFKQAPGFMCVLRGPNHVFEFANDAYERLIGGRDLIGKAVNDALPEAATQGFIQLLDDAYRSGEPYFARGQPVELRSGLDGSLSSRYLDFVYQPIVEADGSVSGIFVQGDDVTERKAAQDELLEADHRKDVFLAMLAHELRNPLAPIAAAAQLLQIATHDENRVRMASEIIGRQVQHMTGLVDDLLDVSRVSRGEVPLNKQPVDIGSVVSAAIEQVRPAIQARHHRLDVQQPPRAPLVCGDRKRLVQVFVNLLDNAAKYTRPGGVITLRLESDDDQVRVSVRDNGIGIESRLLPHIFDLFTQAKRSADRSQGGLGVGLSLVRGILQLHGGSIDARSGGLHAGSEFVVSLPRHDEPVSLPASDATAARRPSGRPLQVLIVDDNRDAASTLALCLRDAGHHVVIEEDSLRALKHVSQHPADVYLLDIGLPNMDGNELARRIRAHAHGRRPLLVAVTGYGQQSSREAALEAGFDHYFVKPADAGKLIRLLAAHGDAASPAGNVAAI
jgi:signal transduction histidine kinase/CheY-like chemotaxis protein